MHWFTADDGTRFLVQTPVECARSLKQAFPDPGVPVTSRRFMAHVKKECPPPAGAGGRRERAGGGPAP